MKFTQLDCVSDNAILIFIDTIAEKQQNTEVETFRADTLQYKDYAHVLFNVLSVVCHFFSYKK